MDPEEKKSYDQNAWKCCRYMINKKIPFKRFMPEKVDESLLSELLA
jgi:hypothetical protein